MPPFFIHRCFAAARPPTARDRRGGGFRLLSRRRQTRLVAPKVEHGRRGVRRHFVARRQPAGARARVALAAVHDVSPVAREDVLRARLRARVHDPPEERRRGGRVAVHGDDRDAQPPEELVGDRLAGPGRGRSRSFVAIVRDRSRSFAIAGRGRPRQADRRPRQAEAGRGRPRQAEAGRGRPRQAEAGRGRPIAGRGRPRQADRRPRQAEAGRGRPRQAVPGRNDRAGDRARPRGNHSRWDSNGCLT